MTTPVRFLVGARAQPERAAAPVGGTAPDVPPDQQKVLRFPLAGAAQKVRLVAERDVGRSVRSQSFLVNDKSTVVNWDLSPNSLWLANGAQK
jgi:hypothetical protein